MLLNSQLVFLKLLNTPVKQENCDDTPLTVSELGDICDETSLSVVSYLVVLDPPRTTGCKPPS